MDYWVLFTIGAIGWGGLGVTTWMLQKRCGFEVRLLPRHPEANITPIQGFTAPSGVIAIHGSRATASAETIIEPEIPEEIHRLAEMADPLLDQYDTVPQSGEWKRHQVYASMLKNPKVKAIIGDDKWKAGFAIELAVAQRRMSAEEVGA